MSRQYIPFTINVNNIALIVYPVKDENPLEEIFADKEEIIEHVKNIYNKHKSLENGEYHIIS